MKDKAIFLIILKPIIWLITKTIFFARFYGVENISENSALILAGNHSSILDCLLVISASKRPPHFLVKKELYKNVFSKWFFTYCGTIPVDRSKKNPDAMAKCKEYLYNKKIITIFPEGTINRTDDVIMPFKFGAVKLSSETSSPIVPFVIKGKYKFFRKSISITFLKPLEIKDDLDIYNNELMKIISNNLEGEVK